MKTRAVEYRSPDLLIGAVLFNMVQDTEQHYEKAFVKKTQQSVEL